MKHRINVNITWAGTLKFGPIFYFFHRLRSYLCSKQVLLGSYKQARHRIHCDEPFFTLRSSLHDWAWPKKIYFGPKRPNIAGLSTFQSGPKGYKRDQNGKPKCSWTFGTLLGTSGPFWTISDKNEFDLTGQSRVWQRCIGAKYQFLFEMVHKGPAGPKRVPNG